MSTLTPHGRPLPRSGSSPARSALAALSAFAVLAISTPAVWADAQSELNAALSPKTTLNASAAQLAAAVASVITSTGTSNPGNVAAAAFLPTTVGATQKVRSDRDTSAGTVAESAIAAIASGDANFASKVAGITDSLVDVNGADTAQNLSTAGKGAVVKDSLEKLSDEAAAASPAITPTDFSTAVTAIGQTLAGDTFLQGLPTPALTTVLQTGIEGIYGAKKNDTTNAPAEAANYVNGILTAGLPNSSTYATFGVAILKDVNTNASVDEQVANVIGTKDTPSDLPAVGTALITAYSKETVKITQGLVASITAVNDTESGRVTFLTNLLANTTPAKNAVSVIQGAVYCDPYFAGDFTNAAFNAVVGGTPTTASKKALASDATKAASAIGNILGADGDTLTQVAQVFGTDIGNGDLPVTKATAYATDLINGAVKSTVATTAFTQTAAYPPGGPGGKLNSGNLAVGITGPVLDDLVSIVDLVAGGIVTANIGVGTTLSGSSLTKAESEIGGLAAAVAKLAKNELFTTPNGTSVAGYIAGELAKYITASFGSLSGAPDTGIIAAIKSKVDAVSNAAVKADINAQLADYSGDRYIGVIGSEETAVTNL